jgi:hypothetical protein
MAKRRRKAFGNAKLLAPLGDALPRTLDLDCGGVHRLLPYGIVIEREFGAHLVLEVGEQFRAALLRRRFENLLALLNEPPQIIALGLADGGWNFGMRDLGHWLALQQRLVASVGPSVRRRVGALSYMRTRAVVVSKFLRAIRNFVKADSNFLIFGSIES